MALQNTDEIARRKCRLHRGCIQNRMNGSSQREHFCSTKMIMSRVKHRYCQNTGGCVTTAEPNVVEQNGSVGCNGRWKVAAGREEAGDVCTCTLCAGKRWRYRIAPLGSRNTVGMSSKNNAPVCSAPSALAGTAKLTLIGLDLAGAYRPPDILSP